MEKSSLKMFLLLIHLAPLFQFSLGGSISNNISTSWCKRCLKSTVFALLERFYDPLEDLVSGVGDASSSKTGVHNYFHTLYHQLFPGSLADGNVGKELNNWLDERISHPTDANYKKDQVLRLLLSLLKIALQHYGKLRSSFGTDATSKVKIDPFHEVKRKRDKKEYGAYKAKEALIMSIV